MAKKEYIPVFPYKGDQAIISSGRILFHAKDDSIFLFGKKAVGISSTGVINLDCYESLSISSPKIELGLKAADAGEPIMLGRTTNNILLEILSDLQELGDALSNLSDSSLAEASIVISKAGISVRDKAKRYYEEINAKDYNLSKISFTR
jgi:hypothetical protein